MGGIELHPAVQRLSEKNDPTLEERAIVGLMRTHLEITLEHHRNLLRWLQEVNPINLRGPANKKWAEEVADWILPTQLRRHNGKEQEQQGSEGNAGVQVGIAEVIQRGEGDQQETSGSYRHE